MCPLIGRKKVNPARGKKNAFPELSRKSRGMTLRQSIDRYLKNRDGLARGQVIKIDEVRGGIVKETTITIFERREAV